MAKCAQNDQLHIMIKFAKESSRMSRPAASGAAGPVACDWRLPYSPASPCRQLTQPHEQPLASQRLWGREARLHTPSGSAN